jgi:hypothetical protein
MPKSLVVLLLAVASVGCASAEPEPAAPPLAGVYSFSTTVQGMPVDGQMRITGEPGDYGGSLYSQFTGELPFTSVTRSGDQVTLLANTPDGPVEIRLVFEGDTFTGDWAMGPEGGTIQGRRVR